MQGGDISNEVPGRILVTYDYLTEETVRPKKFLGVVVGTETVRTISEPTMSSIGRMASKIGARLELVVLGSDDDDADQVLADIDRRAWQPFNYARGYGSAFEFVSALPYRPEVMGVLDVPERMAAYGSYGISLDYLARAI